MRILIVAIVLLLNIPAGSESTVSVGCLTFRARGLREPGSLLRGPRACAFLDTDWEDGSNHLLPPPAWPRQVADKDRVCRMVIAIRGGCGRAAVPEDDGEGKLVVDEGTGVQDGDEMEDVLSDLGVGKNASWAGDDAMLDKILAK